MNIIRKLTFKSLKLNKKRSIGTIIGIILSVALICAIAGMGTSLRATLVEGAIEDSGYNHFQFEGISKDKVKELTLNRDIKYVGSIYDLGYAEFKHDQDEDQPYIHIKSLGKENLSFIGAKLTNGTMPKNEHELVVSELALINGHLTLGDTINLSVGERNSDGYLLDDSNPYTDEEKLVNDVLKSYKIVGTISGPKYNFQYIGFTSKEVTDNITAYAVLKNPFKHKEVISDLFDVKKYEQLSENESKKIHETYGEFTANSELLRWEAFALSDSTTSMIITVLAIVIGIVIFTSVFCIRNSFAISTLEKIKMYGMLASIGATKKQIKKSVIFEGLILSCIAIPIGVASGILADYVIVKVVNFLVSDFLSTGKALVFSMNIIPIILAIVLGLLTVYLSSISSARRASKVSPIDNLRNSNDIKIQSKKLKTPKIINSLFKTGGVLAYKNLKRSKKKYRTTIISLTISIFTFISMNAFINEGFGFTSNYYQDLDYNIKVNGVTKIDDKEIQNIKSLDKYDMFGVNYFQKNYFLISREKANDFMDDIYGEHCAYDADGNEVSCEKETSIGIEIHALDHESYLAYLKKLKLSNADYKGKGILIDDYQTYNENGVSVKQRIYKYKKGDIITGKIADQDFSIEVLKVTDERPIGLEQTYYMGGYIIVDYNDVNKKDFNVDCILMNTKNHKDVVDKIEDLYPGISIYDLDEEAKQQRNVLIVISIFLYGFIAVITLIGVTNIFNTITSNMELRQKEFAMLKSIGMTKKEFKRMINLETIFYTSKSLLYGILLGILGSYAIHRAFGLKTIKTFNLPIVPIIISIVFVFALVNVIMRYSMRKINKQNIIETIRKDNI